MQWIVVPAVGFLFAREAACARAGLLFKRSAYNFVSLAHNEAVVDRSLDLLDEALSAVPKSA